jgi:hypothetical protein
MVRVKVMLTFKMGYAVFSNVVSEKGYGGDERDKLLVEIVYYLLYLLFFICC